MSVKQNIKRLQQIEKKLKEEKETGQNETPQWMIDLAENGDEVIAELIKSKPSGKKLEDFF